ncbi:hypothetical protein QBC38DRAFT_125498 [Podospora fimiseda]|uniref:SMP domain-containing protein n=1 Tax=Podospora fimiseda TaxID=252190 RepID=A0AAN6YRM2_9PEZI|nr:hypothetical protein QBC38DRAFT_125498 [Podospora fimiseda]
MDGILPNKDLLIAEAASGKPITQSAATAIAAAESDITGRGPIKGGPAATAQSIHDRQENLLVMAGDVARKPTNEITKEDAAKVQRAESRALGHPVGKDSLSAEVQSIAAKNENKHQG